MCAKLHAHIWANPAVARDASTASLGSSYWLFTRSNEFVCRKKPTVLAYMEEFLLFHQHALQKNRNMAFLSRILALDPTKRAREMNYECPDARKCCHATL
jgi:hypothetical protein